MLTDRTKKIITYSLLALIVIFNVYIYRGEIRILPEVNDNSFQFALVNEATGLWRQILAGKLSPFYLVDSFNNRWNEGLSLSTYYSHLPQTVISLLAIVTRIDPHTLFNWIKYLMLVLLPVTFFFGARILGLSNGYALLTAFFAQSIFTDGYYGIDSTSFLWRGWGLSSQLFGVFFLPLAFAYAYSYLTDKKNLGKAILFNFLVAECHSGVFLMMVISYPIIIGYELVMSFQRKLESRSPGSQIESGMTRLLTLGGILFLILAYFLIPFFTQGSYRNFSFWDPRWKFDSFGLKQTAIWFFNGSLFDFNRLPFLTFLTLFGVFVGLRKKDKFLNFITLAFLVYGVLYLGRATLGSVIDVIPGMSEFHLHRFIVMVQFTGIFLAAGLIANFQFSIFNFQSIFNDLVFKRLKIGNWKFIGNWKLVIGNSAIIIGVIIAIIAVYYMELPVVKYARENNDLIKQFNKSYEQEYAAYEKIVQKLRSLPSGRVSAGRPGNWGRDFKVGGQQVYMAISQDGFATLGNSPESWSPNAEFDQFFDENNLDFYNLYNIRYLIVPADFKPPAFVKPVLESGHYRLYQVETTGWFDIGRSDMTIGGRKTDFINIVHLWLTSYQVRNKNYPRIVLQKNPSDTITEMWQKYPFASAANFTDESINWQERVDGQSYKIDFSLKKDCFNCVIILKNTYHPNWQIYVNGKKVEAFPVFPFFIGIPVTKAGEYHLTAVYKPSSLKILLIWAAVAMLLMYLVSRIKYLVWR